MECHRRRLVKQINNILIHVRPNGQAECVTDEGVALDDFGFPATVERAIRWATETTDFLKKAR